MSPDKTNSIEPDQYSALEKESLSYAQFSLLMAQYKRAVYESIHQAENPLAVLLKL